MNNFESFKNEEHNPRLGETNRFLNGPVGFKEKVNQQAIILVKKAMPVLERIEANTKEWNFHDPASENKWAGQFLMEFEREKLNPLYGSEVMSTEGVSTEVLDFIKRVEKLRTKVQENPSLREPI